MIHVIGNSHVSTFSNCNFVSKEESKGDFKLHYIGTLTAKYYLKKYSNKLNAVLKNISESDYVIPIAGEVDCRFHIPLQADRKKIKDKYMTMEFMWGYMEVFDYLLNLGYKPIAFGTHPTTTEKHDISDINRPIYGDMIRRNNISNLWNELLEEESQKRGIPYFSIYGYLVNDKNETNMDYFLDYCHLNGEKVYPFIKEELCNLHLV